MSTVKELSDRLHSIGQEIETAVSQLSQLEQSISEQAEAIKVEIDDTTTGQEVSQTFSSAIEATSEAINSLTISAQMAKDYATTILNS